MVVIQAKWYNQTLQPAGDRPVPIMWHGYVNL